MTTHCVRCGASLDPGSLFCGSCGAQQTSEPTKASAMQSAPAAPPGAVAGGGEQIGTGVVIAAALGLLALFGVLFALASVVRDANAEARENEVLAGKISVLGTAKVREWTSAGFDIQVPAAWANIATGQALQKGGTGELAGNQIHTWQDRREAPRNAAVCDRDVGCLSIQINRQGDNGNIESPRAAAQRAQRDALDAPGYRYRDLGPVTMRGGRWAWRWVFDQGGLEKVTYFFATCSGGERDALWTVRTIAPAGTYDDQDFADTLGSLETRSAPEPADGGCKRVIE